MIVMVSKSKIALMVSSSRGKDRIMLPSVGETANKPPDFDY